MGSLLNMFKYAIKVFGHAFKVFNDVSKTFNHASKAFNKHLMKGIVDSVNGMFTIYSL